VRGRSLSRFCLNFAAGFGGNPENPLGRLWNASLRILQDLALQVRALASQSGNVATRPRELSANPLATGSIARTMTTGIVSLPVVLRQ